MSPKVVDKTKKREAILRKAMQVFAKRGFFDFKMIDIARAAGVGKGTLYEYFKSKTELVNGCTSLFMVDYERFLRDRMAGVERPEDKIYMLVRGTFEFFSGQPERIELIFDFWAFTYRTKEKKEKAFGTLEHFRPIIDRVAGIIRQGTRTGRFRKVNTHLAASMLVAMLDGMLFQSAMGFIRLDDKRLARSVGATFLEGILS